MKPNTGIVLVLSLLFACKAAESYLTFEEGAANSTIEIRAVVDEYRTFTCTVRNDSESELKDLIPMPLPAGDDNWYWIKEEDQAQLIISKISNSNKNSIFSCEAIDTEGHKTTLAYHITEVYELSFKEGPTNSTVSTGLTVGTKAEIRCTIEAADPAITELTIEPTPVGNEDYKVIGEEKKWVGIEFITINDLTPLEFTCMAKSEATLAKLTYSLTLYDGITFDQGPVNGSVNQTLITETQDTLTCSVKSSDPPLVSLTFEPPPPIGNEDYKIEKVNDTIVQVKFLKINNNTPVKFQCIARNNMTTATMDYNLNLKDPVAPVFTLGSNITYWNEMKTGVNSTLECTVIPGVAVPEVTMISVEPPEEGNSKYIKKDEYSMEIQITNADQTNRKNYICTATNGVRHVVLDYQNYVGGPPDGLDVSLHTVLSKNKIKFSLSVTDRSLAPAKWILVNLKGVTDKNISLAVPIPDNYDDEIDYAFSDFMTHDLTDVVQNSEVTIYANNTLGDAYVKTVSVAIPEKKSSPNSGAIAAGVLIPFFLVLGALVAGVVVYYFWKKNKTGKSISFSKISGSENIEDAKSTYGAL